MFVTQPPSRALKLRCHPNPVSSISKHEWIRGKSGVRIGHLLSSLKKQIEAYKELVDFDHSSKEWRLIIKGCVEDTSPWVAEARGLEAGDERSGVVALEAESGESSDDEPGYLRERGQVLRLGNETFWTS